MFSRPSRLLSIFRLLSRPRPQSNARRAPTGLGVQRGQWDGELRLLPTLISHSPLLHDGQVCRLLLYVGPPSFFRLSLPLIKHVGSTDRRRAKLRAARYQASGRPRRCESVLTTDHYIMWSALCYLFPPGMGRTLG